MFLHEHPATAQSWKEPCIQELLKKLGVQRATLDMCCFNLQSSDDEGQLVENQLSVVENVKPKLESMTVDAQNV